jgi:hypothetical protein
MTEKEKVVVRALIILSVLIGVFWVGVMAGKSMCNKPVEEITKEQVIQEISFEDSVYNYILELNIQHPEVVLRQARIESGNFKSRIFLENNNMFGMKMPNKRPNMASGSNRGYAVYNNWKESVIDYALYQVYSGKNLSKEDYIKMLNDNYAEDTEYLNKLIK